MVRGVRNALCAWLDLANESSGKAVSIPSGRIRDVIQSLTFRPPTADGLDLLSTLAELRQRATDAAAVATRHDWIVRCPEGDLGWWDERSARRILARRRSHHPDDGPCELIRRTWAARDEVIATPDTAAAVAEQTGDPR